MCKVQSREGGACWAAPARGGGGLCVTGDCTIVIVTEEEDPGVQRQSGERLCVKCCLRTDVLWSPCLPGRAATLLRPRPGGWAG